MLKARRSRGEAAMMGDGSDGQKPLFYSFNLETHIPPDHLLRGIDQCLDLSELRRHLASFYSHTGRPSIDPELMIRMLIVGYCFGIRSERRLCEEVHLNLAYRWFCRLGLEEAVPDHSTFSKNRHGRFRESGAFRHLFETVLQRCISEGLVGGEGFAIDASVVKADASRASGIAGAELPQRKLDSDGATRAVREYLEAVDQAVGGRPETERKNVSLTDPAAEWTCDSGSQGESVGAITDNGFGHAWPLRRGAKLDPHKGHPKALRGSVLFLPDGGEQRRFDARRIADQHDASDLRYRRLERLDALRNQVELQIGDAGDVSAGPGEARHKSPADRVPHAGHHDRNR